jgi:hypothetical protein
MRQHPAHESDQAATIRAEKILERTGQQIGFFIGQTGQRIRQTANSAREQAGHLDQLKQARTGKETPPTSASKKGGVESIATARAEETVDRMGEQLGHYTAQANFLLQRTVARVREEAEDMWSEAQNIHQQSRRTHPL